MQTDGFLTRQTPPRRIAQTKRTGIPIDHQSATTSQITYLCADMHHSSFGDGRKIMYLQAAWDPAEVLAYIDVHGITDIDYDDIFFGAPAEIRPVLEPYSFIQNLSVSSMRVHDWSFLQSFTHLESVRLYVPVHASIDLSACSRLRHATVPWHEGIGVQSLPNLNWLAFIKYPRINLQPFTGPPGLQILHLMNTQLQSLHGIADYAGLQNLYLSKCRHLRRITALNGLPHLQTLSINGSRKIKDYAKLTDLAALKRLELDFCGDIPSITFLRKLKSLEFVRLGGNTRVMDRNTVPLEEIPAGFYNRLQLKEKWGPRK
jgi:hypothetical protein